VNEVIFTEIMYDPHDGLDDGQAEWMELQNLTGEALDVANCVVTDAGGGSSRLVGSIAAGGRYVVARVADPARNGGVVAQSAFTFTLNNSPETVALRCDGTPIDSVAYDDGGRFPHARKASLSLDPAHFTAEDNNQGENWCLGQGVYTPEDITPHLGTPGAPNPACPVPDPCLPDPCGAGERCVDGECLPSAPAEGEIVFSEVLYSPAAPLGEDAQWFELTSVVDGARDLTGCTVEALSGGQLGFGMVIGPRASLVFARSAEAALNGGLQTDGVFVFGLDTADLLTLTCGDTIIDVVLWDDGDAFPAASGASISLDAASTDALANDDGASWCLGQAPYGDGTQRGTPGEANPACPVVPRECEPACADGEVCNDGACEPAPCEPACADGDVCDHGACVPAPCEPACADDEVCDHGACIPVPCEPACAAGEVCEHGACVAPPARAPVLGDVIFTEILYDTASPVSEDAGEWVELTNITGATLDLSTCVLTDATVIGRTPLAGTIPAGGRRLYVRSADPARNGGLVPDGTFGLQLGNNGDTVNLTCGGVLIDRVVFDADFSGASGRSMSLDPAHFTAADNDVADNWCAGVEVYTPQGVTAHRGSPGRLNPACP
jgi:hypothetical protein